MNCSRRRFVGAAAAGLTYWAAPRLARSLETKPNLLFISVDDLNDWVSVLQGYPDVYTPNLERLARRGVTFTRAYCSAPECNPSRVSVLTGLRPSTSEVYTNQDRLRDFHPKITTMPEAFRTAGYKVTGGGKVFHGDFPYSRLWVDYSGATELPWSAFDHTPRLWDEYLTFPADPVPSGLPLNGISKPTFDWGATDVPEEETPDFQLASWAATMLERPHSKPLFMALGFFRPHLPWYVPKQYFDLYPLEEIVLPPMLPDDLNDVPPLARSWASNLNDHQDILQHNQWRPAVQGYLASISYVDSQLGRVLDALERGPNASNTIVVLWSDHGFHLGEKLHWRKWTLWERATRVPMIIAAPGFARAGERCDRTVSLLDLYPTVEALCGLGPSESQEGRNLAPLLGQPFQDWDYPAVTTWEVGNHSVRTGRWRYIRYYDETEELYDEQSDPNEWSNLAGDPGLADLKRELGRSLEPILDAEQSLRRELEIFLRKVKRKLPF